MKIFFELGINKHEKKVADLIYSTNIVRYCSSFGSNGPTAFIMNGKKRRNFYDERFLENHGAAPGSTISMTYNAFVTDKAWAEVY